jgi:4a-hydroxytetrahydrobiopterin dehydratase
MNLAQKECLACSGELPLLSIDEQKQLLCQIQNWQINEAAHLQKRFKLNDFKEALKLANQIGAIAEEAGHHPDLLVRWAELEVTIWTHKVNGLTETDFILAAKIDQALKL